MPVEGRWYEFTREKILALESDLVGIYTISDNDKIPVYIGSSRESNIRGRLLSHLSKNECCKINGRYFKYSLAGDSEDAEQMEAKAVFAHMRKHNKRPICLKRFPRLYFDLF
jgi:hypothetical protein